MTIHYHGTPITSRAVLNTLAGKHFCVSHSSPNDVAVCHSIGQSVMLDNGAFSAWRVGRPTNWPKYYAWVEPWLDYRTTWAVIPDVIGDSEADNDALLDQWPFGQRGAPVWHMHEPIKRLLMLAERWDRICIGSSGDYSVVGSPHWCGRMNAAMNDLCGDGPAPVWLHMLRGMALVGSGYPFSSVDSTNVARNHNRPGNAALDMVNKWDAIQCPARWKRRPTQTELGLETA